MFFSEVLVLITRFLLVCCGVLCGIECGVGVFRFENEECKIFISFGTLMFELERRD